MQHIALGQPPALKSQPISVAPVAPADDAELGFGVDTSATRELARLELSGQCILVIGLNGRLLWMSTEARRAAQLLDPAIVLGRQWLELWPSRERPTVTMAFETACLGVPARFTASSPTAAGNETHWEVNLAPDGPAHEGGLTLIAYAQDVTERLLALAKLEWSATHDGLTGLPNRALLHRALDSMIGSSIIAGQRFALVVFDLDRFQRLNERLGHEVGDQLLQAFGRRLADMVPAGGMAARYGNDEFALIMSVTGSFEEATLHLATISDQLRFAHAHAAGPIECTASAGFAVFPEAGATSDELFAHAEFALHAGKAREPGRAVMFSGDMRQALQRRASALTLAAAALEGSWIEPHYQPKIDLATGGLWGFEALLRWRRPDGQWQSPAAISAAFDDKALATKITEVVLRKVILDLQRWQRNGCAVPVAVNVSGVDLHAEDFAERLLARLEEGGLSPALIELEVTEGVFLGEGSARVGCILRKLSHAGVRIALDDFGTGYASLSHLKQFPVQVIKIDRSFVAGIASDHEDRAIVKTMIDLGRSMSIEVVAEGIESEEQLSFLKEHGCHVGQGYVFSKALPAAEVEASYLLSFSESVFCQPPDGDVKQSTPDELGDTLDRSERLRDGPQLEGNYAERENFDDRRAEPRIETTIAGRLRLPASEHDCQLVDLSPGGMNVVAAGASVAVGMQVTVLTQSLPQLVGTVRWMNGESFGAQFGAPISPDSMASVGESRRRVHSPRAGRIKTDFPALVFFGGAQHDVIVRNISVGGLMITLRNSPRRGQRNPIHYGQALMIQFQDLLPIGGHVRWACGSQAGIMFSKLLPTPLAEHLGRIWDLPTAWIDDIRLAHLALKADPR